MKAMAVGWSGLGRPPKGEESEQDLKAATAIGAPCWAFPCSGSMSILDGRGSILSFRMRQVRLRETRRLATQVLRGRGRAQAL